MFSVVTSQTLAGIGGYLPRAQEVNVTRVDRLEKADKHGEGQKQQSHLLPPWAEDEWMALERAAVWDNHRTGAMDLVEEHSPPTEPGQGDGPAHKHVPPDLQF